MTCDSTSANDCSQCLGQRFVDFFVSFFPVQFFLLVLSFPSSSFVFFFISFGGLLCFLLFFSIFFFVFFSYPLAAFRANERKICVYGWIWIRQICAFRYTLSRYNREKRKRTKKKITEKEKQVEKENEKKKTKESKRE